MNCPYCNKHIPGMTGYQEAENFQRHLNRCRQKPLNVTIVKDGNQTSIHIRKFTIQDALEIRASSGQ